MHPPGPRFASVPEIWHHPRRGRAAVAVAPARGAPHSTAWGVAVRYLYMGLIVAFTALVLLFTIQNLQSVTVSLLTASMTLPLSVLVVATYVLGMLTGGFLLAVLRTGIQRAKRIG
jgi:uncharacterized integral membrane protein